MNIVEKPQGDLFARKAFPEGFALQESVISAAEEADAIDWFAGLPFKPFDFHGFEGKRRIVSFGYRYDYSERRLRESEPIPDMLTRLRAKAAGAMGFVPADFRQVLVTEYALGAGIGWHRDKPMFSDIVALSFASSCTLRFRKCAGAKWERANCGVPPRSAYLLSGPARWEWEHSISGGQQLRYSVTFRNFVEA